MTTNDLDNTGMEGKLVSTCVHRFAVNLNITVFELMVEELERTLKFNVEKQNASWSIQFYIDATRSKITFSTDPASALQKTQRIQCKIINDPKANLITFEGGDERLKKELDFFTWNDVQKAYNPAGNVKISFDIVEAYSKENVRAMLNRATNLQVASFFESGEYSDVMIATSEKEFKAHKVVLASRSPVFAAMFRNNMQEAATGKVTINDVETEVFEEMLRYMYSNFSARLSEMPYELFAAAHMYDVQDLQRLCLDYLIQNICLDNVVKILKLCDTYVLGNVKEKVLKFVDDNEALIVKREEYLVYLKENMNVENVTKNLLLAQKHELADFKIFLMDFIVKNYAKVMQNNDYRQMYRDSRSMHLILEIDEYISNNFAKLRE